MPKALTKQQFIDKSNAIHKHKYDYSNVEYINNRTKVCIRCPIHGDFWQEPKSHLCGNGCPQCKRLVIKFKVQGKHRELKVERKKSIKFQPNFKYKNVKIHNVNEFIGFANDIHNSKYDYSKVNYTNKSTKVCIICPIHGEFWQKPNSHLIGHGCPQCGYKISSNKQKYTKQEFITKADLIHNHIYDYSKVDYVTNSTKVCIICQEHGEFWQRPQDHLKGQGCPKCRIVKLKKLFSHTKEQFIKKSNEIFHDEFDYSNVEYINNSTKVKVICKKHGEFLVTPKNHLKGRGCPKCKEELYVYENRLYNLLKNKLKIKNVIRQYKSNWLSNNKSLDFYLPDYKIAIEHQGSQHFQAVNLFGGEEKFLRTQLLDNEKYKECVDNNIKLLYFSYEKSAVPQDYIDTVFIDEEEFIEKIKNLIKNI